MKDPSNRVVNEFGFRKGLVTTFMSEDPKTCHNQTSGERVERPHSESASTVKDRIRQIDDARLHQRVRICSRLVDACEQEEIPDPGVPCHNRESVQGCLNLHVDG